MWIKIISLFPEIFSAITEYGVIGRAVKNGLLKIQCWNPRDYTNDKRKTVDNRPYGGGPGMIMMPQPLRNTIHAVKSTINEDAKVIYLSPQGRTLNHQGVCQLKKNKNIIFVCGRYEGIDERIIDTDIDEEWSIGDYVLSGGELAAMVIIDSIARLIPGVLGHHASSSEDSFMAGLLDFPHYTRPKTLEGITVPSVLLSGNHAAIKRWRSKQSLGRTWLRRPELLRHISLTDDQKILLAEFQQEYQEQKRVNKTIA